MSLLLLVAKTKNIKAFGLVDNKRLAGVVKKIIKKLPILTLFRMGFFGAAHVWGGGLFGPLPKICHIYPTMMKLGTVIP